MENWSSPFRARPLLRRLVEHRVDFVVVGGIAMIAHGSARLTQDLDICYATEAINLERLGRSLVALGASLHGIPDDLPFVPDARTLRRTMILTLDSDDGRIDLLVEPAGAPRYVLLKDRALKVDMEGITVLVASLDDLESMKRAAGRPKDLVDLEEIAVIRRLRGDA